MSSSQASLQFLGAAGTVTGSMHLLRAGNRRILLDCGLFQGMKALRLRNWAPRVPDPASLDAVILSHAHLDHSGYLPLLARQGFRGAIYATAATADLARLVLPDAAHLEMEHAERANRYGYTKHAPALPLYDLDDARRALELFQPRPFGEAFDVAGCRVTFRRAGHILGSATVEVLLPPPVSQRVVFTGDLGRYGRPILRDPEPVPEADVLLVESTYGNRTHAGDPEGELARVLRETAARGGTLLIPAFAIDRTQELLWFIHHLEREHAVPALPVYVDSPMAIEATEVYRRHPEAFDETMAAALAAGDTPLRPAHLHIARSPEESRAINDVRGPVVIISSSGMATGGRVLHHLSRRLGDAGTTVLTVGFQAAGTRGRALEEGAKTVRIFGQDVVVRARTEQISGLSAHADRDETLRWLGGFRTPPGATWLVHGEPDAAAALAAAIHARLGWATHVAADGGTVPLGG